MFVGNHINFSMWLKGGSKITKYSIIMYVSESVDPFQPYVNVDSEVAAVGIVCAKTFKIL